MATGADICLPDELALEGLFTRNGYRPAMALKRLEPEVYFASLNPSEILPWRSELLDGRDEDFLFEPEREADREAVLRFAGMFVSVNGVRTFRGLGMVWEPDFVLLNRDDEGKAVGGCVCFPTGWSLGEKRNQPVLTIHEPVPGLNAHLGPSIGQFFARLGPGECYQRSNWSLTSSRKMNQRPGDAIPEIGSNCDPIATFLRVEWQALIALDASRILFGIRIYHCSLEAVRQNLGAALLLAENLRTMPEKMLRYKRLARCRERVIGLLGG
jgi:heme-dependent oxidative N-demethylase alpha subunit-like protein